MFGKVGQAIIEIVGDSSNFERDVEKSGSSIGGKMAAGLGAALKVGVGAAVAASGVVIAKGFQRLNAIDQAQAKMRGLGYEGENLQGIMDSALKSVKGTAFGLGDAANAAANALNAGIEPGEQLDRTLKAVVGSAAASGASMTDLQGIFNKAATSGKANNEVLGQLAERGIPIVKQLAEDLGVSQEAIYEMARAGEISFDQLIDSAGKASGSIAEEMGKTLQGRLSNAWAAIGRIGANLLGGKDGTGGIFGALGPALGKATEWLGGLEDKALVAGEKIGAFVADIQTKATALLDFFKTGDFTTAFREAFNVEEDSGLVKFLLGVREAVKKTVDFIKDTAIPGIQGLFDLLVGGNFSGKLTEAFGWEEDSLPVDALFKLRDAAIAVGDYITGTIIPAVQDFGKFLNENRDIVVGVGTAILAYKGYMMLLHGVTKTVTIVTKIWTGVQKALNAVMKMNPIGLLVAAIAALIAVLIYAYKNNEDFRKAVDKAWAAIKTAISTVVDWITGTAWPFIKGVWESIADGAQQMWALLKGAWDGIKTAISAVVDWLTGTAWPFVKDVFDKIGKAVEFLYVNFIRPQWILIKMAIDAVVKWLKDTAWPFIKDVWDKIAAGAKWLYENAIKPAWEGIKKGIEVVVDWLKNTAWPFIKQVWDLIAAGAKWLWENGIKPAWDGIKRGIEVVVNWLRDTAWPIIKAAWDKIADGAKAMWEKWIKPAFDNFKSGLDVIVGAVGKAKDAIATTWGKITDAISGPLDKARTFINDKFISPLNKLFETLKMTLRIPLIGGGSSGARGAQGVSSSGGPMLAMASGGTVPGFSPHPRADNIPIWATAGEFMLPVNATKRLMSQVGAQGMEMLRRGQIPGYALGGLIDWAKGGVAWVKEKGTDIIDLASKAWDVISDPLGYLKDFATKALAGIGDNPLVQAMSAGASRIVDSLVAKIKEWFGAGGGGDRGGNNMGWQAMKAWFEATFPGQRITSGYRPGAVSVTGITSDHALGRAIDMPASMAIFNKIDSTWGNIRQLLYSPAGPRQIRGGRRSDTIGSALRAQHWDHVHWSMADGGLVQPFGRFRPFVADSGVRLAPGINVLDNRTGGPEPLARTDVAQRLHPDDIRALVEATAQAVERGAYRGVSEIGRGLALSGGRY